jgi:hypothetical protein
MVARASGRARPGLRPRPVARFEPGDAIATTIEGWDAEGIERPGPPRVRSGPPPRPGSGRLEAGAVDRTPVVTALADGSAAGLTAETESAPPASVEPSDEAPAHGVRVAAEITVAPDAASATTAVDPAPDAATVTARPVPARPDRVSARRIAGTVAAAAEVETVTESATAKAGAPAPDLGHEWRRNGAAPARSRIGSTLGERPPRNEAPTVIEVTIGRLDLRTVPAPTPVPARRRETAEPPLPLAEYLRQRSGRP